MDEESVSDALLFGECLVVRCSPLLVPVMCVGARLSPFLL